MVFGGSVPLHDTTETQDAKCSLFEHGLRSFPAHHCTGSATPAMLQAQRDFWCSCESHTVSHRQELHCGVPFLSTGSYLGCWSHLTVRYQNRFSSVATLLPLPKAATRQNAWRFPGGGKRKIGLRVRCT